LWGLLLWFLEDTLFWEQGWSRRRGRGQERCKRLDCRGCRVQGRVRVGCTLEVVVVEDTWMVVGGSQVG